MLVSDRTATRGRALLDVVEAALRGGVDAVQLREKDLPARELAGLARELRRACDRHGAKLLVNDRVDVALATGADGVHLPAASFSPQDARALLGSTRLVGVSCHSSEEARAAAAAGADYVVVGPVFATPSKRAYGAPIGLATLQDAVRTASVPVLAIGGIGAAEAEQVVACGAAGVAVVRAVLAADDPQEAGRALTRALVAPGSLR